MASHTLETLVGETFAGFPVRPHRAADDVPFHFSVALREVDDAPSLSDISFDLIEDTVRAEAVRRADPGISHVTAHVDRIGSLPVLVIRAVRAHY